MSLPRAFKWLPIALLGGALLARGTHAAAAGAEVEIHDADTSALPAVTLTVSVRGTAVVSAEDIRVVEDGTSASSVEVSSLADAGAVEVVLAVDTSGSMRGEPITAAVSAARQFIRSLPAGVRVGVLAFAAKPRVLQPVSGDRAAAVEALGSLAPGGGTSLYDAVVKGTHMFEGPGQRNMVLLSDGADTRSRAGLRGAVAIARAAGVTVFSVGLRTSETDIVALRTLATTSRGTYASSGTPQLERVYQGVVADLAHQFAVSFRSQGEPGEKTSVTVSVAGGSATTSVRLPPPAAAAAGTGPEPQTQPQPEGVPFLSGERGRMAVLGLFFAAVFLLLLLLIGGVARVRRDRELATRIEPPSVGAPAGGVGADQPAHVPESIVAAAEHFAETGGFLSGVERALERADVHLRAGELVMGTVAAAFLGGLLGWIVSGAAAAAGAAFVAGATPGLVLAVAGSRRSDRMQAQLPDVLMVLSGSLRAGHSFLQALDTVAKDVAEPGASEFARVVAEVRLGRPVDQAMNAMAERVRSDDFTWVVLAVNIQREVGGNLAEILDTVADTLRERASVRRQIRVLSAEGRLSMYILVALPFVVGAFMGIVNPTYLSLLFEDPLGRLLLVLGASSMITGVVVMSRMVRIDV